MSLLWWSFVLQKSRYYNIRFYLVTIFRWRGLLKGEFGLELSILIFKPRCLSQKRKFPNIAISFPTLFRIGLCRIFILLANYSISDRLLISYFKERFRLRIWPTSKQMRQSCNISKSVKCETLEQHANVLLPDPFISAWWMYLACVLYVYSITHNK